MFGKKNSEEREGKMEGGYPSPQFPARTKTCKSLHSGWSLGRLRELRLYNEDVRKRFPFM